MASIQGVEIFAPGHWYPHGGPKNGMKLDVNYVKELAANTAKKGVKAILKLGHSTKQILKGQTDGDPALGSAGNFRMKGDKLIADFLDLPPILYKAIRKKLFKSVSVEIRKDAKGKHFIEKIAILGADLPAVKSLKDLQAFFTDGTPESTLCFTVMSWNEAENGISAIMRDPADFRDNTFRTKDLEEVEGIQIITGNLKPDKFSEETKPESAVLQAYRFSKELWNKEKAEKWIAERESSEKKSFSLNFSEPFFIDELFFETPVKDGKMGEEKRESGVSPEKHAEILTQLNIARKELADLKEANDGLMQFKEKVEDTDAAQAQIELEKAQKKITELEDEKVSFSEKISEQVKELSELKEKVKESEEKELAIQFSIKKDEILAPYKTDVKEGKLPPVIVKKLEQHLDSQSADFSEKSELTIPADLTREIGQAYAGSLPQGEQGNDDSDVDGMNFANASEELEHETIKLQAKNSDLDYKSATDLALRLNPQLEAKYKDWLAKEYAA